MSSQLNPIGSNIASFRSQRRSVNPRVPRTVTSQGYPPNSMASTVTISSARAALSMEPVLNLADVEFVSVDYSADFLQEPIVTKEIEIKNFPSRARDAIVHDMDELMAGKEDEEKPTEYAYANARRIIESAYGKAKIASGVSTTVPKPLATTDDVGGIRLLWNLGAKNVRLNFGADDDRQTYLYFEAGLNHGVEPLDEEHLATRLAWLTAR